MTAQEMFELVQLGGWRTMERPAWAIPAPRTRTAPGHLRQHRRHRGKRGASAVWRTPPPSYWPPRSARTWPRRMGVMIDRGGPLRRRQRLVRPRHQYAPECLRGPEFRSTTPRTPSCPACWRPSRCWGGPVKGMYCYIKHFALNDQETNRHSYSSFANEQSVPQSTSPPFEMAVEGAAPRR